MGWEAKGMDGELGKKEVCEGVRMWWDEDVIICVYRNWEDGGKFPRLPSLPMII